MVINRNPEYFLTIAREKSISRAAEKLYISQSSLSQYIAKLEDALEVKLFDRSRNPIQLTEAGRIYQSYLESNDHLYQKLQSDLCSLNSNRSQELNIGLGTWRGSLLLPEILPDFLAQHPQAQVTLFEFPVSELATLTINEHAKLERVEVDEVDTSRLNLKFPPAPRSGDYPIIAEGVGKNYGSHVVFSNATFTIKRGEKVAFVGKNGEGKSTLVKCIMGEIPYTGTLKIGHNVKIGYFAQNQASLLDESITVFDTIDRVAVGDIRTKIRDILGAFMFGGEASDKKVKVLSGGEKTRLAMIRLLLEPVNLLILDEPTNHLDMRTKDVLKQAIRDFNGTVILVSHDREFLDGLVSKVYEFGGGQVREHLGGIYDFLESRKLASLRELEQRATVSKTEKDGNISKDSASPAQSEDSKLSYGEQKEFARRLRKAEKAVADIESEIAGLEKRIAEVEEKLATPDGAADTSLYELHGQLKKQLDDVMWKWSEASEVLDKLQK